MTLAELRKKYIGKRVSDSYANRHSISIDIDLDDYRYFAEVTIDDDRKITHISKRSTREKILSYLSHESQCQGSLSFDIPFNRQDMADYLCVDRAAMTVEISKLQREGVLKTNRNHFELEIEEKLKVK